MARTPKFEVGAVVSWLDHRMFTGRESDNCYTVISVVPAGDLELEMAGIHIRGYACKLLDSRGAEMEPMVHEGGLVPYKGPIVLQ